MKILSLLPVFALFLLHAPAHADFMPPACKPGECGPGGYPAKPGSGGNPFQNGGDEDSGPVCNDEPVVRGPLETLQPGDSRMLEICSGVNSGQDPVALVNWILTTTRTKGQTTIQDSAGSNLHLTWPIAISSAQVTQDACSRCVTFLVTKK